MFCLSLNQILQILALHLFPLGSPPVAPPLTHMGNDPVSAMYKELMHDMNEREYASTNE